MPSKVRTVDEIKLPGKVPHVLRRNFKDFSSHFFMVHLLNDPKKMMPNLMEKVSRAPREPRRTRTSSIVEVETPKKSIWKPEKSIKKLKKLVFRMFLEGTYGVALRAKELSDVKADSRAGDLDDVTDLVGENVLPMLKTINYTLSVTSWTRRKPQPLSPWGERGDEMVVVANVYPVTERNETEVVKVEKQFQKCVHTRLE